MLRNLFLFYDETNYIVGSNYACFIYTIIRIFSVCVIYLSRIYCMYESILVLRRRNYPVWVKKCGGYEGEKQQQYRGRSFFTGESHYDGGLTKGEARGSEREINKLL